MGAGSKAAQRDYLSRLIAHLKGEVKRFSLAELPEIRKPITPEQVAKALRGGGLRTLKVNGSRVVIDANAERGLCSLESTWADDLTNYRRCTQRS